MHERSYRRQTVDKARTTFRQPTQNHALASVDTVITLQRRRQIPLLKIPQANPIQNRC